MAEALRRERVQEVGRPALPRQRVGERKERTAQPASPVGGRAEHPGQPLIPPSTFPVQRTAAARRAWPGASLVLGRVEGSALSAGEPTARRAPCRRRAQRRGSVGERPKEELPEVERPAEDQPPAARPLEQRLVAERPEDERAASGAAHWLAPAAAAQAERHGEPVQRSPGVWAQGVAEMPLRDSRAAAEERSHRRPPLEARW